MPKTKEFKTIEQQIEGLEKRDLKFKNKKKASEILLKYNYFDIINGFETILLKQGVDDKKYQNVYFEDFWDLYKFDMKLKKHTLFKIFDLESRMRTAIAYHFTSIYCNSEATTMNYVNRSYYQAPDSTDKHLVNKFKTFDLFRDTQYDFKTGKIKRKSYIDTLKKEKDYIRQYSKPPFWVVIKSLPLGSLYYLFLFLKDEIKKLVLYEFGFSINETPVFEQAIYVMREVRNQCAHLELITRFRLKRSEKLNGFCELTNYVKLSKTEFNYMDVMKIYKIFGNIRDIKWTIGLFYLKMCLKGRKKIADKVLAKMGRDNIWAWLKI